MFAPVFNPLAAEAIGILEKTGPMPFRALACALRLPRRKWYRLAKAVRALHAAGYASLRRVGGVEFVVPSGFPPFHPGRQLAFAWFVARLVEAGGQIEGNLARFPKGTPRPVMVVPPDTGVLPGCVVVLRDKGKLPAGAAYWCRAEELKTLPLSRCLRKC